MADQRACVIVRIIQACLNDVDPVEDSRYLKRFKMRFRIKFLANYDMRENELNGFTL